jgi:hypothetical protein
MDFILKDFLFKKKWAPNIPGSNSTYIIRIMGTSVRNVGGEFKKKSLAEDWILAVDLQSPSYMSYWTSLIFYCATSCDPSDALRYCDVGN